MHPQKGGTGTSGSLFALRALNTHPDLTLAVVAAGGALMHGLFLMILVNATDPMRSQVCAVAVVSVAHCPCRVPSQRRLPLAITAELLSPANALLTGSSSYAHLPPHGRPRGRRRPLLLAAPGVAHSGEQGHRSLACAALLRPDVRHPGQRSPPGLRGCLSLRLWRGLSLKTVGE